MLNIQSQLDSTTLNALVARYQSKRENNCFDLIVQGTVNFVRETMNKLRFDADIRDDLFQVGLMAIARCAESYDAERGNDFLTYAGRSVKNRMINEIKKFYNHSHTSLETPLDGEGKITLGDTLESTVNVDSKLGEIEAVRKAMENLTSLERDTVVKVNFEGMTFQDVATERGCTRQAVYAVHKTALKRLKEEIQI